MIDYIMPHWSKYAGEDISDVPRKYLDFLLEQDWIDKHPDLIEAAEDQFAIRDRSHITF